VNHRPWGLQAAEIRKLHRAGTCKSEVGPAGRSELRCSRFCLVVSESTQNVKRKPNSPQSDRGMFVAEGLIKPFGWSKYFWLAMLLPKALP